MRFFKKPAVPPPKPTFVQPGDIIIPNGYVYRVHPDCLKRLPIIPIGGKTPMQLAKEQA